MKKIKKVFITSVIYLCVFVFLPYAHSGAEDASNSQKEPTFQKGMCFATWDKDKFSSQGAKHALKKLKNDIGAEYIQINVTLYQDKFNSTKIKSTKRTPSDKSVKNAIKAAHDMGLKIMLKPHIDLIDTDGGECWRGDIGFQKEKDWKKWFRQYEKLITHYAKMANKYCVELFCVGTELSFAAQKTDHWKAIISTVKNIYPGKLIYAANWDNYKNIEFWSDLDFVGIDAYFPLSYEVEPTVKDIKEGWNKWAAEIEAWYSDINKPIVFTEIGYSSASGAAREPWKRGNGNADILMQAKCYAAFFEALWSRPWLAGVYWWRWAPSIRGGGKHNRNFTPLNKPASEILKENYKSERRPIEKFPKKPVIFHPHNPQPDSQLITHNPSQDLTLLETIISKARSHVTTLKNMHFFSAGTLIPPLRSGKDK